MEEMMRTQEVYMWPGMMPILEQDEKWHELINTPGDIEIILLHPEDHSIIGRVTIIEALVDLPKLEG